MSDASEHGKSSSPVGQKGYTGNPGGRPKMSEEHRRAFTEISELGIKALRAILDGTDETARASDKVKASEVAFDRAWGKAVQQVDANVTDTTKRIDTSKLNRNQLDVIAALAIESMNQETDDQS